ncbi:restriction endonuclease subunit S [Pseudomonas sp. S9]|uniref:restriction endonuclease subunit S n=1 Tax=Pseudomonas sp. S9 TaxID=686578 RepID=UPI000255765B|nr:restriction endonuclease subunit S [Pseudomonas sp. S9]
MGVTPGYKQTEVGLIPEEWRVAAIGEITDIRVGRDLQEDKFSTFGDSTYRFPVYSNTVAGLGLYGFYSTPEYEGDSLTVVGRGVGLGTAFARTGGYGAVGRLLVLLVGSRVNARFLATYINERVSIFVETGGIPQLTGVQFSKYRVALPSLPEQRAIATALSDVDTLLDALGRLIAKKRDLKQAAMQQLLTGQTRLPGFQGEWVVKLVGDIAHVKTGSRNNEHKVEDGLYPFFVRSEFVERINSYSHDCEAILVPGEGRIGDIFHYINGRFDVHQRVYAITKFIPDISGRFIHFYLSKNFGAWAMQNTVKATVDSLRLPTFLTFEMRLPPTKAEQTAIATVLSDMDAELVALEQRLAKTRALKQGMMQELLTGRTRLV